MFTDNEEHAESIVATSDMCLYCFNTLLKELLPKSQPSEANHHDIKSTKNKQVNGDTSVYNDIRKLLEHQQSIYTPPAVDCPLFVTWSKYSNEYPTPPIINVDNVAQKSSSGLVTPATTTTTTSSESNITDFSTTDTDNEEVTTPPLHQQKQDEYDESNYDLRGCIGSLSPKSLQQSLSDFALTSALHDQRFDPIELHEIPYLKVGVSLLVKYETCSDCFDWEVGVHGIIIKFSIESSSSHRTKSYNATYLPEIAHEQQWTQQETVLSLIRKAGYRGVITEVLLQGIHCTRYQSSKFQLTYQEYCHAMKVRHGGNIDGLDLQKVLTAAAVDETMGRQSRTKSSCVIF